jgi:hypothetical protein
VNTTIAARPVVQPAVADEKPRYEVPRVQVMTEREILNTFQITQSMNSWWLTPTC